MVKSLSDLTLSQFLVLLRERGYEDKADLLDKAVTSKLLHLWDRKFVDNLPYGTVLLMVRMAGILDQPSKPKGFTVEDRIAQLRREGWNVVTP